MRRLTHEALHVTPPLVGAPLASPTRRLLAFAIDGLILVIPTIAVALGAAFFSLQASDPRAAHAVVSFVRASRGDTATRHEAMHDLVPLLVRTEAAGVPASVKAAVEEGDLERAAAVMKDYDITFSLRFAEGGAEKDLPPRAVRLEVAELIPGYVRGVALLGVPALYFIAFASSRRGATPGKRALGIRIARLDGERLSLLESLERFVGYVHVPGTMFLSLADLWRDPNRRLPHDRTVHTAVFRVKRHEAFPPLAKGASR